MCLYVIAVGITYFNGRSFSKRRVLTDSVLNTVMVSDLEVAGFIATVVAQQSPLLADSEKQAISQNYFGAPLATAPRVHTVTAEEISCEKNVLDTTTPRCSVRFDRTSIQLSDEDALGMYSALKKAGIVEYVTDDIALITVQPLTCVVDDIKVQSSPGDNIEGFSCLLHTAQQVVSTAEKIRRYEQCVFSIGNKEYFVSPCTVDASFGGVISVGVAEGDSVTSANPFFYFTTGSTPDESTATWNRAEESRLRADVPLPGVWMYANECIASTEWKLCFPEDISSMLKQ